jgi:hypothetical protein
MVECEKLKPRELNGSSGAYPHKMIIVPNDSHEYFSVSTMMTMKVAFIRPSIPILANIDTVVGVYIGCLF